MDITKKTSGLIKLMRLELPLAAGVCVILGQVLAGSGFAPLSSTALGFFSMLFISASILVLNDIIDLETDKINAPERPLPSGQVTPSEALIFAIVLMLCGFVMSYVISFSILIMAIGLAAIGFLYNRRFKKHGLWGNLMVSFSVGMTFIYGGATVGKPFSKAVLFFALIAALVDLGEEIAADAMDMAGDKLINSNSIAIRHGKAAARKISTSVFIAVVLLTAFPFIFRWFTLVYLIPMAVMDFFIVFAVLKLNQTGQKNERKYIRMIYLGATFGLVVFLLMKLLGVK